MRKVRPNSGVLLQSRCRRAARRGDLVFLVKAARPGFWTTSLWFYLLPLGQKNVWFSPSFWLGAFYVTLPLGLLIYGWNDLADAESDRHNPRKGTFLFGARGTDEQLARLPLRIALVQAIFLAAFIALLGAKAALWFAALVFSTAIYNWPRYGLKGRPPFEVLNQIGYLLVFVLSSWLNDVPQLPLWAMVFGACFAMHSHLFGEIMDIVPDRLTGRNTTATVLGSVPVKAIIATFLLAESALVFGFFGDRLIAGFLMLSALWFVLDATVIWRDRLYRPAEMRVFLLGWNALAVLTMPYVWLTATLTH